MTHIKPKHKIKQLTEQDIAKRMRKDRVYYHCCSCREIYEDKKKSVLIMRLSTSFIPAVFSDYHISSGLCDYCYKNRRVLKNER